MNKDLQVDLFSPLDNDKFIQIDKFNYFDFSNEVSSIDNPENHNNECKCSHSKLVSTNISIHKIPSKKFEFNQNQKSFLSVHQEINSGEFSTEKGGTGYSLEEIQEYNTKSKSLKNKVRSVQRSSLTLISGCAGVGMLGLPKVMSYFGLIAGILVFVIMGVLSYHSILCLTEAIQKSDKTRYPKIVKHYLGQVIFLNNKKKEGSKNRIESDNLGCVCFYCIVYNHFMEFDPKCFDNFQYI